jgi:hypothetical protein
MVEAILPSSDRSRSHRLPLSPLDTDHKGPPQPASPSALNYLAREPGFCRVRPNLGGDFRGGRRPPPLRGDHRPISFELPSARWTGCQRLFLLRALAVQKRLLGLAKRLAVWLFGHVSISEACAVACVCDRH